MNAMSFKQLENIPAGHNPFAHDSYHMGMRLGNNVTVMYGQHVGEHQPYIILIDGSTGERVRIEFAKKSS